MIRIETALAFMKGLSSDEARRMTVDRLTGRNLTPAGDARLDESPEDVLIQVLRAQPREVELSAGIIRGCMEVYHLIEDALSLGEPKEWDGDFIAMVRSLSSLVNLAKPEPLKKHARAMLSYVTPPNEVPPDIGMHLVQAFMGYDQTDEDAPFWERLLDSRHYAAFAFNALVRLDPFNLRVDRALAELAAKRRDRGWTVDVAFLSKRMISARKQVRQQMMEQWGQIVASMQYQLAPQQAQTSGSIQQTIKVSILSPIKDFISKLLNGVEEMPSTRSQTPYYTIVVPKYGTRPIDSLVTESNPSVIKDYYKEARQVNRDSSESIKVCSQLLMNDGKLYPPTEPAISRSQVFSMLAPTYSEKKASRLVH